MGTTPAAAGTRGPDEPSGVDAPLDDTDLALLAQIREIFAAADPMPAGLPDRIRFRLALRDLETEMACLLEEQDELAAAVRGGAQSRTVTFDSESLTIMIRIDVNQDGTAHIDGWLAPPQRREIELRTAAGPLTAAGDDQGRFAFTRVPRGTARLAVRPPASGPGPLPRTVVTPALVL